MANMPNTLPVLPAIANADLMTATGKEHGDVHTAERAEIVAIATMVGTNAQGPHYADVKARLDANDTLVGSLAGPQNWLYSLFYG